MAGSTREKYPGVWELRASNGFDPITAKRLAVSRSARGTKRIAQLELAKLVASIEEGRTSTVDGRITVAALVDAFLERWTGAGSTLVGYRSIQETHIRPAIGRHQVRKVTPRMVDDLAGGVPLKNASARIGHRIASTTLNIYTQSLDSHDAGDAEPG